MSRDSLANIVGLRRPRRLFLWWWQRWKWWSEVGGGDRIVAGASSEERLMVPKKELLLLVGGYSVCVPQSTISVKDTAHLHAGDENGTEFNLRCGLLLISKERKSGESGLE
uniref:Uncharacterized protein n=1 Tax=Salix viminalis TaxID=40686 RepID=A0A6N2L0J5_SALVM